MQDVLRSLHIAGFLGFMEKGLAEAQGKDWRDSIFRALPEVQRAFSVGYNPTGIWANPLKPDPLGCPPDPNFAVNTRRDIYGAGISVYNSHPKRAGSSLSQFQVL